MSHSRLAIYDRSELGEREYSERCVGIRKIDHQVDEDYYWNPDYLYWYPSLAPFPTPLIYLRQKKL